MGTRTVSLQPDYQLAVLEMCFLFQRLRCTLLRTRRDPLVTKHEKITKHHPQQFVPFIANQPFMDANNISAVCDGKQASSAGRFKSVSRTKASFGTRRLSLRGCMNPCLEKTAIVGGIKISQFNGLLWLSLKFHIIGLGVRSTCQHVDSTSVTFLQVAPIIPKVRPVGARPQIPSRSERTLQRPFGRNKCWSKTKNYFTLSDHHHVV